MFDWGHDLDLLVQPVRLVTFGDIARVQSVELDADTDTAMFCDTVQSIICT